MADVTDNVDTESFKHLERLRQLRIEHRDLDDVIHRLQLDLYVDQVQMRRLKEAQAAAQGPDRPAREPADSRPERLSPMPKSLQAAGEIVHRLLLPRACCSSP